MERVGKSIKRYVVLGVVIFLSVFWTICLCAKSANENAVSYSENQYQIFEKEYLQEVKAVLFDLGYEESGVTMTRVSFLDGKRTYQVSVYHRLLDERVDRQKEVLEKLNLVDFEDSSCEFQVSFLCNCLK